MSKKLLDPKDEQEVKEAIEKGYVFNRDAEIEWLKFSDKQNNKPGKKSIVNHNMAAKLVAAKKAKIVRAYVPRPKLKTAEELRTEALKEAKQ